MVENKISDFRQNAAVLTENYIIFFLLDCNRKS